MNDGPIRNGETFVLADDCQGVIWQDDAGWHGCLKWDLESSTDFVGPFVSRRNVLAAVRLSFIRAVVVDGGPTNEGRDHAQP